MIVSDPQDALLARLAALEERLAREELARRDAEEAARCANEVKGRFLANMSHELRTPLNGLVGASELALQAHLPAEAREYVELIHRSSLALFEVVAGILDVARLEAGALELRPVVFDARAAVAASIARHAPAAAGKGLALGMTGGQAPPLMVEGDELRFCQVLGHLVGNAVKFTDKGSVTVTLHARERAGGACELTVCVRDTGNGVRPEDLERIFTMFSQGDGSDSRAYGGTGLGLAVCQGLARLMGGALGVSSVYGKGATFIFRVEMPLRPAAAAPTVAAPSPRAVAETSRGPGNAVLLVEDNPVNRELAERILAREGCRVDAAENGAEAVLLARERRYDLILMDLQMPVMDGLQATRAIRKQEGDGPRVPIIALTANAMPGDREACLRAGMDDHLAKPVRTAELVGALRRWLADAPQPA